MGEPDMADVGLEPLELPAVKALRPQLFVRQDFNDIAINGLAEHVTFGPGRYHAPIDVQLQLLNPGLGVGPAGKRLRATHALSAHFGSLSGLSRS